MSRKPKVRWKCPKCGFRDRIPPAEFPVHCACGTVHEYPQGVADEDPPPAPPGDQLKAMFSQVGVRKTKSCRCEEIRREMNRLGVEGCKRERSRLLAKLKTAYDEASLYTKGMAYVLARSKGLPLSLEGLFDLAIERAITPPDSGS